jgi:FG-GAP repeat/Putative metal-binding motif
MPRTSASTLALFTLSCAADLDAVPADLPDSGPLRPADTAAPAPRHASGLLAFSAADRRHLRVAGPGRFTVSPRFGLAAELTSRGLRASAREDTLTLATVAYGGVEVGGAEPELGGCVFDDARVEAACVRRVALNHGNLTEWWLSRADGLEHGWTLHAPPDDGPVSITIALAPGEVLEVDDDGLGASLQGSAGGLWRYDGLSAWDADGVGLPARLVDEDAHLTVEVDVQGARWPVTVDPVLSTETRVTASDGAASHFFGASVSGAGDINGDGYDDIAVGARGDDDNGDNSGSAYVYSGSASGIDVDSEDKLIASDGATEDYFGIRVSGAGDLDGDGYDDVVVGAPNDDDNGEYSGSAYVYYGSASGIDARSEQKLIASDGAAEHYFGWSVAGAGDLDGDGYDDLAVGAPGDGERGTFSGSVYVYYGSATGIDSTSEGRFSASDGVVDAFFGLSLSCAGDIDADGYDDLVVGASGDGGRDSDVGAAYVYSGSATGIDIASEDKVTASDAAPDVNFGLTVSGAGDVDGDGYADIVVGTWEEVTGAAYVYYGAATGIDRASEDRLTPSDGLASDYYGQVVSGAGDRDGDGYDDVVVGAYRDGDNGLHSGAAYVYYGSAGGIDSASEDKITASDGAAQDNFGSSLSGAGDVDGDGYDDLIVGAYGGGDNGPECGSAYVVEGGCRNADSDGDGSACDVDCDDSDAALNPGATEGVGDEVDQDCDGAETCFADSDDDGFTDGVATVASADADCTDAGEGLATDPTGDCDDDNSAVNPAAAEVCDEIDNDCDGTVDNDNALDAATWYTDADSDGYGDPDTSSTACAQPDGATGDATDCDDTDAASFPGATEVEDDGIDQDCDGEDLVGEVKGGCGGCATSPSPRGPGLIVLVGTLLFGLRRRDRGVVRRA